MFRAHPHKRQSCSHPPFPLLLSLSCACVYRRCERRGGCLKGPLEGRGVDAPAANRQRERPRGSVLHLHGGHDVETEYHSPAGLSPYIPHVRAFRIMSLVMVGDTASGSGGGGARVVANDKLVGASGALVLIGDGRHILVCAVLAVGLVKVLFCCEPLIRCVRPTIVPSFTHPLTPSSPPASPRPPPWLLCNHRPFNASASASRSGLRRSPAVLSTRPL